MKKKNMIIVVGCGKFGKELISMLSSKGNYVTCIDKDKEVFADFSQDFDGFFIAGDASDINILKAAGIEEAKAVICTTNDDSINYTISTLAAEYFNVEKIYTIVNHPSTKDLIKNEKIKPIYIYELFLNEFNKLSEGDK